MKNVILAFAFVMISIPNAHAWRIGPIRGDSPKLPNSGQVLKGAATAAGVNEQCERDRKDAEQHQKELDIQKAPTEEHLKTTTTQLANALKKSESLRNQKLKLDRRRALHLEFQKVSSNLVINEQSIKSVIFNLQANNSAESLNEVLQDMEADPKNPHLQDLAQLLRQLAQKNSAELSSLLDNEDGKTLLQQLSTLIGLFQVILIDELADYEVAVTENNNNIAGLQKTQDSLTQSIQQNRTEWNQQEERKACK